MTVPTTRLRPRRPRPSASRSSRIIVRLSITVVLAVAVSVSGGLPLYVFPESDHPRQRVDAVVVLGPANAGRVLQAVAMVERGLAGALVIVRDPSKVTSEPENAACKVPQAVCFLPVPATTRGEAAEVSRLAVKYSWTEVAVITGTPHVTRARYIFESCSTVRTYVLEASEPAHDLIGWARQYAYQSAGFLKAFVVGCLPESG